MLKKPTKIRAALWREIKILISLSDQKRPLPMLLVAALAVGLPAFIGVWLNHFSAAILACMGGLVILYMRQTTIEQRVVRLAFCSFGLTVSFSLGMLSSFNPYLSAFTLGLTVFLATLVCRYYAVPPPGSFFFILVACIARTLPFDLTLAAARTGTLLFGCIGACALAVLYSLLQRYVSKNKIPSVIETQDHHIVALTLEASVIAVFVAGGYLFALSINLNNPYWVPISTAAVMQGATFRAVWHRNVHRIVGTVLGMGLVWFIFRYPLNPWMLAALITLLSFCIEVLVTRNYGLAVMFVTPLTVIFADAAAASMDVETLIKARLVDIILGSCIGYVGGWVMYHRHLFRRLERMVSNRAEH